MRALALFVLLAGCAAPSLEDTRAAAATALAEDVSTNRLVDSVSELVAAHTAEEPLDCTALNLDVIDQERRPVCHLTRHNARALVRDRLETMGYAVSTQDEDDGEFSTSNVIGELRGTTKPEEVVLVGAHFDAFYAGADDNSSGVAAMLEIARALSQRTFARTIRFVGFDLEELGLVGSSRYVRAGGADGLVAAVVFDCIGFSSTSENSQTAPLGLPVSSVGDFVGVIANGTSDGLARELRLVADRLGGIKTETAIAPGSGGWPMTGDLMRSDHAPFWLAGAPALFLTDTANFRNPHYHTDQDHPDTLDPAFLTGVTRLTAAAVAYWAEVEP